MIGKNKTDESVNGVVIGEVTFPYQFWKDNNCICRMSFSSDTEAIKWFELEYPAEFKTGVEMRVFDV